MSIRCPHARKTWARATTRVPTSHDHTRPRARGPGTSLGRRVNVDGDELEEDLEADEANDDPLERRRVAVTVSELALVGMSGHVLMAIRSRASLVTCRPDLLLSSLASMSKSSLIMSSRLLSTSTRRSTSRYFATRR